MPNGGTDNCLTCWFNRKNRGKPGHPDRERLNDPEEPYCTIRDLPVSDPAYTYCANHPAHRPERDPIPIGPVLVAEVIPGTLAYERVIWKPSPDSDEVRDHLLDLLEESTSRTTEVDEYRYRMLPGPGLTDVVVWQLGQFREQRAITRLKWVSENGPDWLANPSRAALQIILDKGPAAPAD